jgi:signal transduction histidine kinase
MRMLGGLIWAMVTVISLMLFLPHQVQIDYKMALFFLFCVLLVNFAAILLPFRESLPNRYFGLLMSLYSMALIGLVCTGIHFTGGVRSPLFAFLLLVTVFCTSFFSSLTAAVLISGFAVGAYLATLLVFPSLYRGDIQLVCTQVFFILLIAFFINRLSVESREQAQERTKALEELRSLSEMDRATSGFVSAVSFEMRTPLTSILGFSEMLANRKLEPEKEQEYVEIISREADNLSRLVEDLLDISRLESGKVNLNKEVSKLDRLLGMSLPILEPACDPSQVVLNIPDDLPGVLVDPQRMKRVFDAVFGYIVRKSGRGSEVRASAKTEGQEVVITLNIRNRQAVAHYESGSRIFPPLGVQDEEDLELAMARRIVLAHKGSMNLIQASGGWFAIVLRLPELVARDFMATSPHRWAPSRKSPPHPGSEEPG